VFRKSQTFCIRDASKGAGNLVPQAGGRKPRRDAIVNEDWKSELAAMYALGVLEPGEAREAADLYTTDSEFAGETAGFREVVASLAKLAPLQPGREVRKRLLARTLPHGLEALVPTDAMPWKPSPFPGVSAKRLFQDPAGNISWMVKLEPGATYPRHRHSTYEHCLVIEGEVRFDEYVLRAGDYEVAGPDTDHSSFFSEHGATLFIIANKRDEVF
jgi:anti-sigma factor ChrR (cupin superfamily)